jgi:methionyl-tRNA synthetase
VWLCLHHATRRRLLLLRVLLSISRPAERLHWGVPLPFDADRVCDVCFDALLQPVLRQCTAELWRRLGWTPPERLGEGLAWGNLSAGQAVVAGPPLFPREVG